MKILGIDYSKKHFDRFGYPQWSLVVTGGIEVVGGVALLVGLVFAPILAVLGGTSIVSTMIGAIPTHLFRVDDPLSQSVPAAIHLIAGLFVTSFRPLSF